MYNVDDSDGYRLVCSECRSDSLIKKSFMLEQGILPPCRMCGGVLIVVRSSDREDGLRQSDRQRGLFGLS